MLNKKKKYKRRSKNKKKEKKNQIKWSLNNIKIIMQFIQLLSLCVLLQK